jgi:hypothetical protein
MDTSQKIYGIARKRSAVVLSWVCFALAILPFFEIAANLISSKVIDIGFLEVTLFWLLLWGFFSVVFYRWAITAKLMISSNSISCDDIASFAGFSTQWENIREIEVTKMRLILWLREPSIAITKVGQWAQNHAFVSPNMMDLSSFIDHWKSGELKKDFERYAPHLFVSGERSEKNAA